MILVPIEKVFFSDNIDAGGAFGKSLQTDDKRGVKLWYLGHGVLVEKKGKRDVLVPIGNVLTMEAGEEITASQWSNGMGTTVELGDHGAVAVVEQVVVVEPGPEPEPASEQRKRGGPKGKSRK